MTFDDLVTSVARNVYPDKVPRVLMPRFRDRVRDALIDLQRDVRQLRTGNISRFDQGSTYYTCGITVIPAPKGQITRVAIQHRGFPGCKGWNGVSVSKPEMQALRSCTPCSGSPLPVNTTPIGGAYQFLIPDPTIDRKQTVTYRKVSMFDGYLWWWPWINSGEEIIVEWSGRKKSWDGADEIPLSFLNEEGEVDREIRKLIELYCTALREGLDSCDRDGTAMGLYTRDLAKYIRDRNMLDELAIEKVWEPACTPYVSPPIEPVVTQLEPPTFSTDTISRLDPPTFVTEEVEVPAVLVCSPAIILPIDVQFVLSMVVSMTSVTPGPYSIRYTLDGSDPTETSTLYTGPITITNTSNFRARTFKPGWLPSTVTTRNFILDVPPVSAVTFSPSPEGFVGSAAVSMATATPAPYEIRYTDNGTVPNPSSPLYTGPITITESKLFRAIVVKPGWLSLAPSQKQYTLVMPVVDPVVFSPGEVHFIDSVAVTLTCPTPGATIRYTTDGSAPNGSSTAYSGPITRTASTTIRAAGFKSGYTTSPESSKAYVKLVPITVNFDRFEYANVMWPQKSVDVGSATNLILRVDGMACAFTLSYNGVEILGGQRFVGVDGDENSFAQFQTTLSGSADTILILGGGGSYFRLGGDTTGITDLHFYVY